MKRDSRSFDEAGQRLRRVDWRFLLGRAPETVVCDADQGLTDAMKVVWPHVVPLDANANPSDLVVLSDPDERTLARAVGAVAPDGVCYIEWTRPALLSRRRRGTQLRAAGLTAIAEYWSWPPPRRRAAHFSLPLDHDGAISYFLNTRARPRSRARRAGRLVARIGWRLGRRWGLLAPTWTIAVRASAEDHVTLENALRSRWQAWGLGPVPRSLSFLMLTGGHSRLNKVVVLVFADDDAIPRVVVKAARVPESERALAREADALHRVAGMAPPELADVPRVVGAEQLAGSFVVAETVVTGDPITSSLTDETHLALAQQVTDLLASFVGEVGDGPATQWEQIIEPVVDEFDRRFGNVVDPEPRRATRQLLADLPPLPVTPEHRDCSPWNVLVTRDRRLALLDWESAEPGGLPLLDLVYYLSNATFFLDKTLATGHEPATYARLLRSTTNWGRTAFDAFTRYCEATRLDPAVVPALRRFTWMVHAAGEHDRLMALHPELSPDDAARRSVFLALWLEEVTTVGEHQRFLVPEPAAGVEPRATAPTFSIVIPAYQAADVIADAIDSALAQTVAVTDIVVCNDGSTDDIATALAPYRDRIVVINRENGGEAAAKNTGVKAATGEYVAILDADDVFHPRRIEALTELAMARPDLDLLTTDAFIVVNGKTVRNCFSEEFPFPVDDQRTAILETNFLPFAAVRRSAYLAVGGFDEAMRRVPDWDCWLRMILAGGRAGLVNEPLAEYRLGATNITSDRIRVHGGLLETLEKTQARSDLTDRERRLVASTITLHKRELAIRLSREAVLEGEPDARRRCARVLVGRGMSVSARAKAAIAVVSPRAARRYLEARDQGVAEVAGGLRVRLDDD